MILKEVSDSTSQKDFLGVNVLVNKHNPNYIQPLNKDVEEVFNPSKNINYKYGNAKRWVLYDGGKPIGRIAAFHNAKYINKGTDYKTGGLGYFDCINNQTAANLLFKQAIEWLKTVGMEAVDGPINFGDRDKNWGLMLSGFDKEPIYGMAFNPDYYQQLFTNFGFKEYYQQYFYDINFKAQLPEKFKARYEKFKSKPEYTTQHFSFKQLDKYAKDFVTVYNAAWSIHKEGKETTKENILTIFKSLKPVIDEKAILFAYYKNEPIGIFVNIPDLNQYFKKLNGKFGWLQKLQVLWMKQQKVCNRLTGLAFGVIPKFQALGIDSFMIQSMSILIQQSRNYEQYEMGWAGEWNPIMINVYKSLGAKQSRVLATYRYIFDDKYPFERHPPIEY